MRKLFYSFIVITLIGSSSAFSQNIDTKASIDNEQKSCIELPEMNVLYRGYENKVDAVAAGYERTSLSGTGVIISKNGSNGWIVKPVGRSREVYLTVTGINTSTGQSKSLKKVKFRVYNLPSPNIYWGTIAPGEKANKSETRLFVKYPPEIPLLATFKIISWECVIPGVPDRVPRGSGEDVSSAFSYIKQAEPGSTVTFICKIVGPDGVVRKKSVSFTI